MKRTPLIPAGSLNRLLQTAEAAWERKDFPAALEAMSNARRLAPSNAAILLRLGAMQGLRCDYAAAENCFEQALRFAPQKTGMLTAVAENCHYFSNLEFKERYLRRAVEQPDTTPLACLKMAELSERFRRLPEAGEFVERALRLNPTFPAALLLRAKLERLAGRLDAAEQVLRSFITKPIPSHWTRVLAWYELGNILDRREQFDAAMSAFLEAKSLLQAQAERNFGRVKINYDELQAFGSQISGDMLRRWADNRSVFQPERRLALLCGYPRSGTTLLEQMLDAHPEITSAEETEIFNDDALPSLKRHHPHEPSRLKLLENADAAALQSSRTAYFHSMELNLGRPLSNQWLIDKNPILTPQIPAFIRIFPEAKFIFALRDPRDVVLSRFMLPQPVVPLTMPFLTLEGTARDYAAVMGFWRKLAPLMPTAYREVHYREAVEDIESVARKTLEFLGVPWDERVLEFADHARKKLVRSPTYADVTKPVYTSALGRWRNYQKYLEPHLATLEPFIKAFGYE